jgi:outer membrane immunogenic protein
MKMLIIATVAGAVLASGSAMAADLPLKAPPPVTYSWTGFYIGGNAGYGWGRSDLDTTAAGPTYPPGYFAATSLPAINAAGQGSVDPHSFVGGGQLGYNWQTGSIVAGLEADFDYFRMNASRAVSGIYPCCIANSPFTLAQSVSTNWLFTARPRLGWAVNNWLFYATGGVAVTDLSSSQSFTDAYLSTINAGESFSASSTRAGWVAGAGIEYGVSRNWSLRAEYLHVDFGSVSGTGAMVPNAVLIAQGNTAPNPFNHSANLTADILRLGINYRF